MLLQESSVLQQLQRAVLASQTAATNLQQQHGTPAACRQHTDEPQQGSDIEWMTWLSLREGGSWLFEPQTDLPACCVASTQYKRSTRRIVVYKSK